MLVDAAYSAVTFPAALRGAASPSPPPLVACAVCACSVGTLHAQLARLHLPVSPRLAAVAEDAARLPVECPFGCHDLVFCSDVCARVAVARGHAMLCPQRNRAAQGFLAMARASEPAKVELLAMVLARIVHAVDGEDGDEEKEEEEKKGRTRRNVPLVDEEKNSRLRTRLQLELDHFAKSEPWSVLNARATIVAHLSAEEARAVVEKTHRGLHDLFREAIGVMPVLGERLTLDGIDRMLGMLDVCTIACPAPVVLTEVIPKLSSVADIHERVQLVQEVQEISAKLMERSEPSFVQSSAIFTLHSCIDHSCQPNAVVQSYVKGDPGYKDMLRFALTRPGADPIKLLSAPLVAVRATSHIQAGDEVLVSYIAHEGKTREERRQLLFETYGFRCECRKCAQFI